MNKKFKRHLSALLAFVMLFTTAFMNSSLSVYADSADEITTDSAIVVENDAEEVENAEAEEAVNLMALNVPEGYTVVSGASVTAPVYKEKYFFNLADGSIVPTNTDGKSDIDAGIFRLKVGNKNAYGYNGEAHGMMLKGGNTIEVDVAGSAMLSIGGCQYSNEGTVEVVATNGGSVVCEKPAAKTAACYHQDGTTIDFTYEGDEATTLTVSYTGSGTLYIPCIYVTPILPPELVGNGKTDVWDFGAEQLDTATYNNMITVADINAQYSEGSAGTGYAIPGDGFNFNNEVVFETAGKLNHRLRSTNKELIRYDEKSLSDVSGNVYSGYIYSNAGSTPAVRVGVKLYKNDILTAMVGSNGGTSNIAVEDESGNVLNEFTYTLAGGKVDTMTFAAPADGMYYLYSKDEKLVVARLYREHTQPVIVSGTVSGESLPSGEWAVKFTNKSTGEATLGNVVGNQYSCYLYEQFDYAVTLENANGFIVGKDDPTFSLAKNAGNTTFDVPISAISLTSFEGEIKGIPAGLLKADALTFTADKIYIPEITISGSAFTLNVEEGVEYAVSVDSSVDDYTLITKTIGSSSADKNIVFEKKPTHKVTINPVGATAADIANATFTFTKITVGGPDIDAETNANGNMAYPDGNYVYTFEGPDNIELRDGQYQVKVVGAGACLQKVTSDVKINGADVTKEVAFSSEPVTEWNFKNAEFWANGNGGVYNTLDASGLATFKSHSVGASIKNGQLLVPVSGPATIILHACYDYQFAFEGEEEVNVKTGSTGTEDEFTYNYTGGAGYVTINVGADKTSYFNDLKVVPVSSNPYKAEITVGADKEYKTIQAAVKAAESMNRPDGESGRVTIKVDPGNYEEIVIVSGNYISIENVAADSAELALANKGIDIGANEVRITSYYAEGCAYYSMGSDYCYNEDVLNANKENGYFTTKNPGGSSGNYWNSTVVVKGSDFHAKGIIFENSFNQYVSEKEANDVVVATNGNFKNLAAVQKSDKSLTQGRTELSKQAFNTDVQKRPYVERASALAVCGDRGVYEKCRVVGRQDSLYNRDNNRAVFKDCILMGAVDYIFGGAILTFDNCELVANTSDLYSKMDQCYITAAQQSSGRGYLFYNCSVRAPEPNVETANTTKNISTAMFGRPWKGTTSETVFFNTTIEEASTTGTSLVAGVAWSTSLGGAAKCYEYGTIEKANVENSKSRANWAPVLKTPVLPDGTPILRYEWTKGNDGWNPFNETPTKLSAEEIASIKVGDTDNDGLYTAADAAIALRIAKNSDMATVWGMDTLVQIATKVVKDGQGITATDASQILAKARNLDFVFDVENVYSSLDA